MASLNRVFIALCSAPAVAGLASDLPKSDHVDVMHGVRVEDPYRWMEDVDAAPVKQWARQQNLTAEAFVGAGVAARAARIRGYSDQITVRQLTRAGGHLFFLRGWAGSPYQGLYVGDPNGAARRLDGGDVSRSVSAADIEESTSAFWPSPDGSMLLSLTIPRGSSWGELRLIESVSGRIVSRHSNVRNGFTAADWNPEGSGYVYSAYDRNEDAPVRGRIVHVSLDGKSETVVEPIPDGADRHHILSPRFGSDGSRLFVHAASGTSGKVDLYLRELGAGPGELRKISVGNGTWTLLGARGEIVWAYTDADAPKGRVVRIEGLSGEMRMRTLVPEGKGAIAAGSQVGGNAIGMFDDRIALLYLEDARPLVRTFDLEGRRLSEFEVPATGTVWNGFHGDREKPELFFQIIGVAEPSTVYRLDLRDGKRELVTRASGGVDPAEIIAERIFVQRPDGAQVPVIIARRRGLSLDRPRKLMMYGYGAFGWVSFLYFQPFVIDWLMHDDGIFAIAGVRGGGEFGSDWHRQGIGRNRQTAIDDYIASAEHLISAGYSSPQRFVANGGSISGGLVGPVLNQRPELFGAAVLDYPVLDLVRFPEFGRARYWVDELGSPKDAQDFAALHRISPYHNIRSSICYPPTLVRIGENDTTVTPMHGYKYTARLQELQSCSKPVLMDVMEGAGHNYGSNPDEIARSHAVALEFLTRVMD